MADKFEYWRELFGEEFPEDAFKIDEDILKATQNSSDDAGKAELVAAKPDSNSNMMDEIYGVNITPSAAPEEKWPYFGGGEPEEEPDIWFDAPGYDTKSGKQVTTEDPLGETHVIPEAGAQTSADEKHITSAKAPVEEPTRLVGHIEEATAENNRKVKKTEEEKFVVRGRRKRSGCLSGLMYFVFIAGISVLLAMLLWLGACDVLALNKDAVTAVVTVDDDFTVGSVAKQLSDAGIIKYELLFKMFAKVSHAQDKIDPGTYELSSQYDYRALIVKMQAGSGSQMTAKVTIPEGYTVKQMFELLDEKNICNYEDLINTAANYNFNHQFLQDLPLGDATRLEGYLFPDTYEFFVDDDPVGVVNKMLNNFNDRLTEEMRAMMEDKGMSLRDVVIVASLIEKEAANDKERPDIASVIYNRLSDWDVPILQIDATIQYALPERKEALTYEDLKIDSPYNTYENPGLPAGPIANPGIASIKAAIEPSETNYYYYALSVDKKHEFFNSYDSFESFINSDKFGG